MKLLLSAPTFGLQTYRPSEPQANAVFSSKPPLFSGIDTVSFSARPSVLFGRKDVVNILRQGDVNSQYVMKDYPIEGYENLTLGVHPDAKVKANGTETKITNQNLTFTPMGNDLKVSLNGTEKLTIKNAKQAPPAVIVVGSDGNTVTVVAKNEKAKTLNMIQEGKLAFDTGALFELKQKSEPSLAILPPEKTDYKKIQQKQLNPIYNVGINFFIPSAGLGSRLFPHTYALGKPALPWNGKQALAGSVLSHLGKVYQNIYSPEKPMTIFVNLLAGKDSVRKGISDARPNNATVHFLDESRELMPGGTASFLGKALLNNPEPYASGFDDKKIVDTQANQTTLSAFGDFSNYNNLDKQRFFFSVQGDGFVTADFIQFMNDAAPYFSPDRSPQGAIVLGYKDKDKDKINSLADFGSFNLTETGELDKFHEKVPYSKKLGNQYLNAGYYFFDAKAQHYAKELYSKMIKEGEKGNTAVFDPAKKDKFDYALHIFTPLSKTPLWKQNDQGQYLDKDGNVVDEKGRIPANSKHTKAFVEFIEGFREDYKKEFGGLPKLYGAYQDGAYVDVGSGKAYYAARQKVLENQTPLKAAQNAHLFFDKQTGMQFAEADLQGKYQTGIDRHKTKGEIIVFPLDNASAN